VEARGPGRHAAGDQRSALLDELFGADGVPDGLAGRLLRTSDVAALFQVSERTVADWASRGRIPSVRTPGGQRRYPAAPIRELLRGDRPATDDTNGGTH
jgi:excisionase family DNA binding protein